MRRQLSEQKSDFLDWHMSDEWNPFKVVRSQHDGSNTFFEKAQLGTAWESNDQTNRRIHALARRSAICWMAERRTVKGSSLWACWKDARLVLHDLHGFAWTPKTHTLCVRILKRDHETLQWSFRTLSVYFGSTITYVGVVEGSAGRMVCHWFLGSLSNIGSWLTAWHLGSACGSTRLIFLHVLTHGDYPIATVKSKVFPSSISPTRIRLVTMSVSISWRGCIWSPNWRPSMGAQRIPIDYWVDVTDQKPLVEVKLFGTLWCASGGLLHISSSMRSRRLPRL